MALVCDYDLPPDYSSTASSPVLEPTTASGLPPPAYQSIEGTPRASTHAHEAEFSLSDEVEAALNRVERVAKRKSAVGSAFTKQVVLNITAFGVLA